MSGFVVVPKEVSPNTGTWASNETKDDSPQEGRLRMEGESRLVYITLQRHLDCFVQVITSPVLETGVTLTHVSIVIDSGLRKVSSEHLASGLKTLDLVFIDQSAQAQRQG